MKYVLKFKKKIHIDQDLLVRVLKTFIQAFGSALVAGASGIADLDTAKVLFIGAVAAGISAVWNVLVEQKKR